MIFIRIQYPKYSNKWNFFFEWHTWMFMFNTQKSHISQIYRLHGFIPNLCKIYYFIGSHCLCRNPSFGLATKAKGLQGCGPRGSSGVTSETPGSVGECEGVSLHTPKTTPKLGEGVSVDSQNFRERFEGSNLNGLLRSLYQWKDLEA
jgi:hypothetical protein